jgi:hypothetical protein
VLTAAAHPVWADNTHSGVVRAAAKRRRRKRASRHAGTQAILQVPSIPVRRVPICVTSRHSCARARSARWQGDEGPQWRARQQASQLLPNQFCMKWLCASALCFSGQWQCSIAPSSMHTAAAGWLAGRWAASLPPAVRGRAAPPPFGMHGVLINVLLQADKGHGVRLRLAGAKRGRSGPG